MTCSIAAAPLLLLLNRIVVCIPGMQLLCAEYAVRVQAVHTASAKPSLHLYTPAYLVPLYVVSEMQALSAVDSSVICVTRLYPTCRIHPLHLNAACNLLALLFLDAAHALLL